MDRPGVSCAIVALGLRLWELVPVMFVFRALAGHGRLFREQQPHQHALAVMLGLIPIPFKLHLLISAYLVLLVNGLLYLAPLQTMFVSIAQPERGQLLLQATPSQSV